MDKYNIIKIHDLVSTNDYALSLRSSEFFHEGLVIVSDFQQKGRGQRGASWESERGKNLILSVVIESRISISKQFDISKIASLSVIDCLFKLGVDSNIKWPNDILVRSNKIAGVLVDNVISQDQVAYSVVGIGLNVNQLNFDTYNPLATSLKLELKKHFSLEQVQNYLLSSLENRIKSYRNKEVLDVKYLDVLFQKDKVSCFEANSIKFNGIIRGVTERGRLIVETGDLINNFDLKDIKMLF